MTYKITIDGPSAAGKGLVASEVAKSLNITRLDTGAMYRAFALFCKENSISSEDTLKINEALENVKIEVFCDGETKIFLNGRDVSYEIRKEEISMLSSKYSGIKEVREYMALRQREFAKVKSIIVEGRDTGSVVFKDADLKIFLTASQNVRAKRRYDELVLRKENVTFEEVLEDIKRRDEADVTRSISPLVKTEDMIEIDTTSLDREQVVEKVLELVNKKGLDKC